MSDTGRWRAARSRILACPIALQRPVAAAEVGTGKTTVALSIASALQPLHFAGTTAELRRSTTQLRAGGGGPCLRSEPAPHD